MIDATMERSVNDFIKWPSALRINRKQVYNLAQKIKVNFRLVSHSHFHHFMTTSSLLVACLPTSDA